MNATLTPVLSLPKICAALLFMTLACQITTTAQLVSPEVHADRTVTFRTHAPKAETVLVKGLPDRDPDAMTKGVNGVWEVTIGPLKPDFYSYLFEIDGADVVDRHNRSLKKWFTLESQFEIPGEPPLLHEQLEVPHGSVTHHIYYSHSAGRERGVYVYTPPGYEAERDLGYPMLLLLHGFGDDEGAWLDVGRANFIADNLLYQGRVEPMIIVMPYGHPVPDEERRFSDTYRLRNEQVMERDVIEDLLPLVLSRYNVSTNRLDHAITGLSMGGGQSLVIGLRNVEHFAWIGAFSASAPTDDLHVRFSSLVEDPLVTNDRLSLLWIACGKDDYLLDRNQAFAKWLDDSEIVHTFTITEGAHTWFVWRDYLASFLQDIFRDS